MTPPFLVCAAMTAISALVSLGFSIAAVRAGAGGTRVVALYAAARSLALAAVSLGALAVGRPAWLEAVACAMIVVQGCDAAIGASIGDRMKTLGPAATAVANAAALGWLLA